MAAEPGDPRQGAPEGAACLALVDATPDIMVLCGGDGVIRFGNGAVTRVLGYLPGEFVGRPLREFLHPEDVERAVTHLRELLEDRPAGRRPGGTTTYAHYDLDANVTASTGALRVSCSIETPLRYVRVAITTGTMTTSTFHVNGFVSDGATYFARGTQIRVT